MKGPSLDNDDSSADLFTATGTGISAIKTCLDLHSVVYVCAQSNTMTHLGDFSFTVGETEAPLLGDANNHNGPII